MLLAFLILLTLISPAQASGISALKQVLQQRYQQPKMYLPDSVMIGEDIKVFVFAPGASKVELYASNEPGQIELEGKPTRLGSDYRKLGEQSSTKANFVINLDPVKDVALIDKFYMFEALVSYDDGRTETANYFGSNANFSNNNAVKIRPLPDNKASAAAIAKSMIPGFAPKQSTGY